MQNEVLNLAEDTLRFSKEIYTEFYNGLETKDEQYIFEYCRVYNDQRGCKNYIEVIHSDLSELLRNNSILDEDIERKYDMGIKLIKDINKFIYMYHKNKDKENDYEM